MFSSIFIIAAVFVNVAWTESCFNTTNAKCMIHGINTRCAAKVQATYFESKDSNGEYDEEECKEDFRKCVSECLDIFKENDYEIDCKKFGELCLYFAYDKKVAERKFIPVVKKCCREVNDNESANTDKVEAFLKCVVITDPKDCDEDGKFIEDTCNRYTKVQDDVCDFQKLGKE